MNNEITPDIANGESPSAWIINDILTSMRCDSMDVDRSIIDELTRFKNITDINEMLIDNFYALHFKNGIDVKAKLIDVRRDHFIFKNIIGAEELVVRSGDLLNCAKNEFIIPLFAFDMIDVDLLR